MFQKAFADGIVQREDLTIMTKVWNDRHGEGDVLVACAQSLRDLKLSYLDIYMVHWPFPNYHAPGAHLEGRNPDAVPFSLEEYLTTWRQMERLVDLGLVKSIGMSNMTITKLEQGIQLIFLTDEEMERLRKADQNARLIKGKVFLWEEAEDWRDIWDGEDAWNIL